MPSRAELRGATVVGAGSEIAATVAGGTPIRSKVKGTHNMAFNNTSRALTVNFIAAAMRADAFSSVKLAESAGRWGKRQSSHAKILLECDRSDPNPATKQKWRLPSLGSSRVRDHFFLDRLTAHRMYQR